MKFQIKKKIRQFSDRFKGQTKLTVSWHTPNRVNIK